MNELICDVALVHGLGNIEFFKIKVTLEKKDLILLRLKHEKEVIVDILQKQKKDGQIKSLARPKNNKLKKEFAEILRAKRNIEHSITRIQKLI